MTPDPLAALFAELGRLRDLTLAEGELFRRGFSRIAGVDEAGRGCLAGPVVAGAVILPRGCVLPGLDDSKKLDADERARLEPEIRRRALAWGSASSRPATSMRPISCEPAWRRCVAP